MLNLSYWNKDEKSRREFLTKSGAGLQSIYNLKPEEITEIEKKETGFTTQREKLLKFYDPATNQFNFSNLPNFNDIYQYSNA
jgi:hypothetical protein